MGDPVSVTKEQIFDIVGRLSDERVTDIIATGATPAEVTEAFAWLTEDEYLGGQLERPLSGVVAEVYEILRAEEMDLDEERTRGA